MVMCKSLGHASVGRKELDPFHSLEYEALVNGELLSTKKVLGLKTRKQRKVKVLKLLQKMGATKLVVIVAISNSPNLLFVPCFSLEQLILALRF